jgi:hypothetical protein
MKTRSNRKGGTRRGSGLMSIAKASMGNLANGGGRLVQFNLILNRVKNWRKFKRMLVQMGGDDINDSKWKDVHLMDDDKIVDPLEKAVAVPVDGKASDLPEGVVVNGGTRKNKRK